MAPGVGHVGSHSVGAVLSHEWTWPFLWEEVWGARAQLKPDEGIVTELTG